MYGPKHWHRALPAGFLLCLLGCGASSDLDDQPAPQSEEEACILANDAEWTGLDCGGWADRCDLQVCENTFDEGCDCLDPEECWDGSACVER